MASRPPKRNGARRPRPVVTEACPTSQRLRATASPPPAFSAEALRERVFDVLRTVRDPEIPVSIVELGLVYAVTVEGDRVEIRMTLTAPNCPVAGEIVREVESRVRAVAGVREARVEIVFDPPWDKSRMTEAARLTLGFEV